MTNWRREDIAIGDRFVYDDKSSVIYEVIAIVERPMVVLRPLGEKQGMARVGTDVHQVIDSDTFSYWKRVSLEGPK